MGVAAGEPFGNRGNGGELPLLEDAVGDAQAAHVAVLRRCNMEETVIAPAEIVVRFRLGAANGIRPKTGISVEWILGRLPLFLVGELAAGSSQALLGGDPGGVGTGRFPPLGRLGAGQGADCRRSRRESFQPALLLRREFLAHGRLYSAGSAAADIPPIA